MINIENIDETSILAENKYYFDTNVWIFLTNPYPNSVSSVELKKQEPYTKFFELLDNSGAKIFINYTTIKEIADYIFKQKYNSIGLNDFKNDFRPTKYYKEAVGSFKSTIKEILESAIFINSFEFDLLDFIDNFSGLNDIDLNDLYFLDFCYKQDYIFVSDDFDCFNYNKKVKILTANKKLLNK